MLSVRTWAVRCSTAIAALTAIVSTCAAAEDKIPVERILPKQTFAAVSVPDVSAFKERFGQTVWADLWDDPEMKFLRTEFQEAFDEAAKALDEEAGLKLDDLLKIPSGELSLAVTRLARGNIGAVALIEYGESQEAVDDLLGAIEEKLEAAEQTREVVDAEDTRIVHYGKPPADGKPAFGLTWFQKDGYLVIGNSVRVLEAILVRWDGQHDDVLANREEFGYIMQRCATGDAAPALYFFVDPILATRTVLEFSDSAQATVMFTTFLPQTGLDKLRAIGGTFDLATEQYESVNQIFIYADSPQRGVLRIMQGRTEPVRAPAWASAEAESFVTVNWDIAGAWQEVRTMVDNFQGAGSFDRILDDLADDPTGPRLHPQKDFIDQLTGRIEIEVASPDQSEADAEDLLALQPDMIVGFGLKDERAMKDVLAKLQKTDGAPFKARDFRGKTIYDVEIPGTPLTGILIDQQTLFFASNIERLEAIARGEGTVRLVDSDEYRRLTAQAPEAAAVWGIENSAAQIERLFEQLKLLVHALEEGGADSLGLGQQVQEGGVPSREAIRKYATSRFYYVIPDERGVYSKDFSLRRKP